MSNIDKIIEAINIPKRIVDNAELFLKKLLGPAIGQTGELIADQIRYRRFKNQVIIFTKAKELLESKSIEPKQINLKTLSPLLEYSSLEEDEKVQNIWSNVIANISSYETEQSLNLKCIEILKEITPDEILILDFFFEKFRVDEKITLEKWKNQSWFKDRTSVYPDNSIFAPWDFKETLQMTQEQLDLYLDRLISFGVIKYEQPNLIESKENAHIQDIFSGTSQSVELKSYELETSERVHFTNFGLYFVKLCKYEK
jgi:hypothetical protein